MKKQIIQERKKTRGDPSWFLSNFQVNLARSAKLMHTCIRLMKTDVALIQEAKRGYIVAITSALETFFHDMFIHVMGQDPPLLESVLLTIKEKVPLADIHVLIKEGVSFPEIAASKTSFQSIEEIERAFAPVFPPDGYLSALGGFEHVCVVPAKGFNLVKMTLPKEWRKEFAEVFRNRHALVHDANLACEIPNDRMAKLETLVLQITHMTTHMAVEKYRANPAPANAMPAFLLITDLISDDWEVMPTSADSAKDG